MTHLKLKQQLIPEVLRGVQAKWQSLPCCHPSSHSDTPPPGLCAQRSPAESRVMSPLSPKQTEGGQKALQ